MTDKPTPIRAEPEIFIALTPPEKAHLQQVINESNLRIQAIIEAYMVSHEAVGYAYNSERGGFVKAQEVAPE